MYVADSIKVALGIENWQLGIWHFGKPSNAMIFLSDNQVSWCPNALKQPLLNQLYVFRYFDNPENTFAVSYNT